MRLSGSGRAAPSCLTIPVHLLLLALVRELGASYCTEEEIGSCISAVRNHTLEKLPGGGKCQPKRYFQMTHICTVNNYVPGNDYCCCAHEQKTMCCRYHHDFRLFRCTDSKDTVDEITDNSLPRELLLTAILVPTAAALCCVICCIRCLCCRDDEDDTRCGCSKCHEKDQTVEKFTVDRSKRYPEVKSLKKSKLFDKKAPISGSQRDDIKDALSLRNGAVPIVPSAPPMEDPALAHLLSSNSQHSPSPAAATSAPVQNTQTNNSGYFLHYVPLQRSTSTPPTKAVDCIYQEIRPLSTVVPNAYQVEPRLSGSTNCCHGNSAPTQTLIGILTNQDGCTILAEPSAMAPRDAPPAYEDLLDKKEKTSFDHSA